MKRVLLAALAALTLVGMSPAAAHQPHQQPSLQPRIVGGAPVPISTVPWQMGVVVNGTNLCGGALIDLQWVLTAAHCVEGSQSIQIYGAMTSLSERALAPERTASQVLVNPNYNGQSFQGDLALLRLSSPFVPSSSLTPIALPDVQDAGTWPAAGTPATISGWGATSYQGAPSQALNAARIQVLGGPADPACGGYGSGFSNAASICAGQPGGGVDTCQGDSGGPLVVDAAGTPTLAGITSVGSECGSPAYPGIYTRITSYLPWIRSVVPAPPLIPDAPTNVQARALADGQMSVSWQPSVAPTFVATAIDAEGPVATCTSAVPPCVISGLTPGSRYQIVVSAQSPTGTSTASPAGALVQAVDMTRKPGTTASPRTVAGWAGLSVKKSERSTVSIPRASKKVCSFTGGKIRFLKAGTCITKVTIASGARKGTSVRAFTAVAR